MQPRERRTTKQKSKESSQGRTFFSKFTSPEQSYAAALRQDKQHPQPKAPQTDGKSVRHPLQQYLSQQGFQKPGLSVQAPISSNNNAVATVVQQIMIELSGAVSEEVRVMVIRKMVLNLMQQNGC
jgi:hypothetical protein